jgi:hypothetical protein
MDATSSVYQLAESIARVEMNRGMEEGRVKSPDAFLRKVRDNMLERAQQRGTGWLVEQAMRHDIPIPLDLQKHAPTRDEIIAKKPAICRKCGIALAYEPVRRVEIVDGWPVAVSPCARGRGEETYETCHTYQEREELGLVRPWHLDELAV